ATLAVAVAVACGPVPGAPLPPAPLNRCASSAECAAYRPYVSGQAEATCDETGICSVSRSFAYVLVVSVPQTVYYGPSQTFVVPSSELFKRSIGDCAVGHCARMPGVATLTG